MNFLPWYMKINLCWKNDNREEDYSSLIWMEQILGAHSFDYRYILRVCIAGQ